MYKGNPILTVLVFGLPMIFLSIIIYSSCCSDVFEARDEEEDEDDEGKILNCYKTTIKIINTRFIIIFPFSLDYSHDKQD